MDIIIVALAAILLVVPFVLAVILLRSRHKSKLEWLVAATSALAFGLYALLVGRWDLFSYYLRPLLAVILLVAAVVSFLRARRTPWLTRPERATGWLGLGVGAFVAVMFCGLAGYAVSGVRAGEESAGLSFPLRSGVSYVGQGGSNPLLNYHNTHRSQAYALDIVGLNSAGLHASGLAPAEPERYAIWGREVHAPCAGTVVGSRDDLMDQSPPTTDTTNVAGNHVVVRCERTSPPVDVLLAHLQLGSLSVEEGVRVEAGQPVGRVGNTGNTSEPHLHVHAVRTGSGTVLDGEAVPIVFDGEFLVRNSLVFGR